MPTETEHARRLTTTRAACDHVTLADKLLVSLRNPSYIKLKFIKNVCSSCKTLEDQVTRNPRYHCMCILTTVILPLTVTLTSVRNHVWEGASHGPNCHCLPVTYTEPWASAQIPHQNGLNEGTSVATWFLIWFYLLPEYGESHGNPPRCGSLRWDSNIWLLVLRYSNQGVIVLQITGPSSRQRKKKEFNCQTKKIKIWS
jgi:hypothetical protein